MELTAKSFIDKVEKAEGPVLVEFWASWCLPCKQVESVLKKLAAKYKDKCAVYKINVDRNPTISQKYNVKGLPTFAVFVKGEEVERKTASQTESEIEAMITGVLDAGSVNEDEQKIIEERLKDLGYL